MSCLIAIGRQAEAAAANEETTTTTTTTRHRRRLVAGYDIDIDVSEEAIDASVAATDGDGDHGAVDRTVARRQAQEEPAGGQGWLGLFDWWLIDVDVSVVLLCNIAGTCW
jgi:hypothetical protein